MSAKPNWYVSCSPRSPEKIIPEIAELAKYDNTHWVGNNSKSQLNFAQDLSNLQSFKGKTFDKEKPFSARDRVAPMKTYGFVYIGKDKNIHLTHAGKMLVENRRPKDVFLKQLVKWQYPSPQHKGLQYPSSTWNIRPFIFFLKILAELQAQEEKGLTKLELAMFILIETQELNLHSVITQILEYRNSIQEYTSINKREEFTDQLFFNIYRQKFGNTTSVREGKSEKSNESAIKTKMRNAEDVSDATFRYFSYTGLFSSQGNRLILNKNRLDEINEIITSDYFNTDYNDVEKFHIEFGNPSFPLFSTDNISSLKKKIALLNKTNLEILNRIEVDFPKVSNERALLKNEMDKLEAADLEILKDILYAQREIHLELQKKLLQLEYKNPQKVQELIDLLNLYYEKGNILKVEIGKKFIAKPNTVLEYLVLNGFIALGGALNYINNYTIDESLHPISHAAGNQSDIEIIYDDFIVLGEVTTSKGKTQYHMEGEPVTRHYSNKFAEIDNKELYCLFIAPTLNSNTIDEFSLFNSQYNQKIIPITISQFVKILTTKKECIHKNINFNVSNLKELLEILFTITINTEIIDIDKDTKIILSNLDAAITNWCNHLLSTRS